VNIYGSIEYVVAGQIFHRWHRLAVVDRGEHGGHFDIANVESRVVGSAGTVVRFDTTVTNSGIVAAPRHDIESISRVTTICARSKDAKHQACFALFTKAQWLTYAVERVEHEASEPTYQRVGAPTSSDEVNATVNVATDGLVRHDVKYETLSHAGDPRCYQWEHNAFAWDER
jgi:hypothetical protein